MHHSLKTPYFKAMALALLTLLLAACGGSSSDSNSGNGFVNPSSVPLMTSNAQGNMTVLNTTDEALIVSTSPTFKNGNGRIWRLANTSATVDLRSLGGPTDLIRLHVIRESALRQARNGTPLAELEVITSPVFTAREGGTWNPYGALWGSQHTKTGTLLVCNYTDDIIGITIGNPMNALEGLVNRGACNVPLRLPADGLMTVYAVEMPSLAVVRQAEVAIFEGQRSELTIGEQQLPPAQATLTLTSNTPWHVNVRNALTGQPLYNSACNNCSTVMAGGSGNFTIPANIEVQIEVTTTDGVHRVLSPIVAVATDGRVDLVLRRDEQGQPEIIEAPPLASGMCMPNDSYWINYYYCG
ncbi:MAG: hypothetical protein LAT61_12760 [Alcanivorax sp.]|nr:hypothetical protein [Alcanivorax sp.]